MTIESHKPKKAVPTADILYLLENITNAAVPDRVIAMLVCAYAETQLIELLQTRMPGLTDDLSKQLFGSNGLALGNKIDLATALGVLSSEQRCELKTMSSVRNKFAHRLTVASFDDDKVAGLVDNLVGHKHFADGVFLKSRRERFIASAIQICGSMRNAAIASV